MIEFGNSDADEEVLVEDEDLDGIAVKIFFVACVIVLFGWNMWGKEVIFFIQKTVYWNYKCL